MQFSSIPGRDALVAGISNLGKAGRLPHALMFCGPEGNGGLALALSLVSYLLCENPLVADSCGQCDACSKNSHLVHPDVHFSFPVISSDGAKLSEVFIKDWRKKLMHNPFLNYDEWMDEIKGKDDQNKQGNISAEECREIIKKLSLKSFEGGKKFMIIWLPEFLGQSGNILLKILEEPPEDTHFILVAEDIQQILPTILSRTQIFNIPSYSAEAIARHLQSEKGLSNEAANSIAYLSKGNLSLALQLMHEEDTSYTDDLRLWLLECYQGNIEKINDRVNTLSGSGREKIKNFLENSLYVLGESLHTRLIQGYTPKVPENNIKFVTDIGKMLDEHKVEQMYTRINDTIYHIERNANTKISLFNLSLHLKHVFRQ